MTSTELLRCSMRWVYGATIIQPGEKGKCNPKIHQSVDVLSMETGKRCSHFGVIWSLRFNRPGLQSLLPPALCECAGPHHLQKPFPKHFHEVSPLELFLLQSCRSPLSSLRRMQCTGLSPLYLCCSLYFAGFTQFAERAVPSLTASSFVRQKVNGSSSLLSLQGKWRAALQPPRHPPPPGTWRSILHPSATDTFVC